MIVELSEHGKAVLPGLKAAWLQLAEQTVALCSTPLGELTRVVTDLARSLTHSGGPVEGSPSGEAGERTGAPITAGQDRF
jgi:hypothetical protein